MPRYAYHCDKCDNILEIVHSIKEKLEICEECTGALTRIPSETFIKFASTTRHKVGDVVNSHIEESRKELKERQQKIGAEEYK